ncbi:MAG: FAD/NAD(P)-binding oxidoreductase [Thermoplasmataceae archaeon]
MSNILVIGGGAGGLMAANGLSKRLGDRIKKGRTHISLIEPSEFHEFQPGYIGIAFKGSSPDSVRRRTSSLIHPGIELIQETCSKVDMDNGFALTDSGRKVDFDYLIIATGCQPDYDQIKGLRTHNLDFHSSAVSSAEIYRKIQAISTGTVVMGIAGLPYKCPPSPNESALLLDEYLTKNGKRGNVRIKFVTPYLRTYPAEPINEVIEPLFKDRNIEVIPGFTVDYADPEKRTVYSLEGDEVQYDTLMMVPPHRTSNFLRGQPFVDDDGWIRTDKRDLHISDHSNAFAIGDVTNIPISKAGVEAHLEAEVVVENIANNIENINEKAIFTGRTQCSMETGYEKATFVIGTYSKPVLKLRPTHERYMMKKMMEAMYWEAIKGNMEFVFKPYFGEDYMELLKGVPPISPVREIPGMVVR